MNLLSRRVALLSGAAAVTAVYRSGSQSVAAPTITAQTATSPMAGTARGSTGTLSAIVTVGGTPYTFSMADAGAINAGNYVDPAGRFTQRCIAVRNAGVPDFLVMFRPDAAGGRNEVVFELGRCFGKPNGFTMSAYSVEIKLDATTLATISVPKHYYYSRWRWQSAPRPVTVTAAALTAANLVPHYDKTLIPGVRCAPYAYIGPMNLNGVPSNMNDTGEKYSIGILPEPAADYLMYEDARSLASVRAWLEGGAAIPWHMRDETTLSPIDFVNTYPLINVNTNGTPVLAYTNDPTHGQQDIFPQISHSPDLGYVMFQLTGDPYALEEIGFQITNAYVLEPSKTFCMSQAVRGYAWHMRDVAHAVVSTPDVVPSWLKPKRYWQTYLDRALAYSLARGPNAPIGSYQQRFSDFSLSLNTKGEVSGFMEEYCCAVFLHMATLRLTGWDVMANWKMQGVIARTNGTSGYNRSIPTAYIRQDTAGSPSAPVHADWAALWAFNASANPFYYASPPVDPTQAHITRHPHVGIGYISYTNACLNMAARLGIVGVAPCKAWLNAEMVGRFPYQRWAIS